MELQDFEALKVIPGYTSILKAVLKSQIQLLVRPNLKIKVKILNFLTLEIFAVIILNSNNVAKPKFFLRKRYADGTANSAEWTHCGDPGAV